MQATYSALIMVCINNEQLERAGEVYQLTVKSGLHPDIHAYNALINAYGCDFQVGSNNKIIIIITILIMVIIIITTTTIIIMITVIITTLSSS